MVTNDEKRLELRPRMGRRSSRPDDSPHRLLRSALLSAKRPRASGGRPPGRSRIAVAAPGRDARRVAVKTYFVRMTAYGAKAAAVHLRYIQRDGVRPDGSPGVLYGHDGPRRSETFEEPRDGERHQFRIIISPDDGHELELTDYVRRVMARVERDTGRKLEWAAVNHYNTEHPHAHVVVRGVDLQGREVRFERSYISNGMRWRAQEIATTELGPRSEWEIQRAYAREVTQERVTSLDRELERRMQDGRVLLRPSGRQGGVAEPTLVARLEHLESMELAERLSSTEWELRSGWQRTLRELSTRRDIIKQMHAAVAGDPSHYQVVAQGQAVPDGKGGVADKPLVGRVVAKGLADEVKGNLYAVVETPSGLAYHLSMASGTADAIRTGDSVTFSTRRAEAVLPVDRHVAEVARSHGGVYAADPHDDRAQAAAHRLRAFERAGLAAEESPGRWRIAPDLLDQLQKRHEAEPPRQRLLVKKQPLTLEEQVHYRGPVWLDRVDPKTLAPFGLGAEVTRARARRNDVLRELGIDPNDTGRLPKLSRVERDLVAEQFAKRSRQAVVDSPMTEFRGRAQEVIAPGGASYAIVSDGQRFVVVRTAEARQWHGKDVAVTRDAMGRPLVRKAPDRGLE
jgi:type IV secretory pathway VirD2 relaxase